MKKIFASLTLAAFMLSGATAFAHARTQATNSTAKTATSHKKKSKRKSRHHASATSATTPSAAAPKKK
jgi:hypothetical protein